MRKPSHLAMKIRSMYGPKMPAPRSPAERRSVRRGLPAKYVGYMAAAPTEHGKREGGR
jgi:hypothetical protein